MIEPLRSHAGCLWACSRIGLEIDARLGDACAPLRLPFRIVPGLTSGVVRMEDVVEEVKPEGPSAGFL